MVALPNTKWAQGRVTLLVEANVNVLSLSQTATVMEVL